MLMKNNVRIDYFYKEEKSINNVCFRFILSVLEISNIPVSMFTGKTSLTMLILLGHLRPSASMVNHRTNC